MKEGSQPPYQVLLYYFYVEIADPDQYRDEHRALCESLGLLGRIIVGNEGINGTVSGTFENCQKYMEALRNDPERSASILGRIPSGRWGEPEDFKGPTVFLASEMSSYVQGTILTVDGGWMGR